MLQDCYALLGLVSFFTVGEDEVRAWSIPEGTRAQDAAGAIHSDIARGFIRAEVVGYDELIAAEGSMAVVRERGRFRLEARTISSATVRSATSASKRRQVARPSAASSHLAIRCGPYGGPSSRLSALERPEGHALHRERQGDRRREGRDESPFLEAGGEERKNPRTEETGEQCP